MKSKRQLRQQQRQRKKLITSGILVAAAIGILALLGFAFLRTPPENPGQAVAVMPDTSHVAEGTDPGPYNTDPPTSGKHYESTLNAGFYHEDDVQSAYPAGPLVHNLEHGYIIFWYNCDPLSEQDCERLKSDIQGVMEDENNNKVIAHPWPSIQEPVVMTSWGRMLRFDRFDSAIANEFISQNRNKAPEPNAP